MGNLMESTAERWDVGFDERRAEMREQHITAMREGRAKAGGSGGGALNLLVGRCSSCGAQNRLGVWQCPESCPRRLAIEDAM
jgi:hypothetical protein